MLIYRVYNEVNSLVTVNVIFVNILSNVPVQIYLVLFRAFN